MEEITLSVYSHGIAAEEKLRALLQDFEEKVGIHVRLDTIQFSALRWPRVVEAALYHSGPDVSEVGSSWVGDLVRMDALRSFSKDEFDQIVDGGYLFDSIVKSHAWVSRGVPVYSIPFTADARVVFFRRDLFEKAGIDEITAFSKFVQLQNTLVALKEKGIPIPIVLPNRWSSMTLQCIASWVWEKGGDFLEPGGTKLVFDSPESLEGFTDYFRLVHHLVSDARDLEEYKADEMFNSGRAAILFSGYWIPSSNMVDAVRTNLRAACMPGIPFVGGSDLVIWNHSRHASVALSLIKYFQSKQAGKYLHPWLGLPIKEHDWRSPILNTDIFQVFKESILKGRTFPHSQLWGLVEKRLTDTFAEIWAEVINAPSGDLDMLVENRIKELAARLQYILPL